MGLPDDQKSFKIGLAVLIQYRRVTDTQPASHVAVAYRAYYVARATRNSAIADKPERRVYRSVNVTNRNKYMLDIFLLCNSIKIRCFTI